MLLLSIPIGFIATIIGALPPGASNIAVVKTSISHNARESLKISYGAGVGESVLALIAFFFGMMVQDFIEDNLWLQYVIAGLLITLGIYLIYKDRNTKAVPASKESKSRYLVGLTLGIVNPPVLIYWVLVFSALRGILGNAENLSIWWLLLFLTGVFIGKVATLYGYSKLGAHLNNKKKANQNNLNRYIGAALSLVGLSQLIKLLFF